MSVNPNYVMKCEKCNVRSYDLIFLQCENCGHMTDRDKESVGENRERLNEFLRERRKAKEEYANRVWRNKNGI